MVARVEIGAVDRRHGTGVEEVCFCSWRVTTPSMSFPFSMSPSTIYVQLVLLILYIFFSCAR